MLAHLRNGDTYQRLATGFNIGIATVYRYITEVVDLLSARAPSLFAAVTRLCWSHNNFGILDGTVIRTDRVNNKTYYSGKHRFYGVNLQGLTDPYGQLLWISDGLPGVTHDTTAARHHGIAPRCDQAGLLLLADSGYTSLASNTLTPTRTARPSTRPAKPPTKPTALYEPAANAASPPSRTATSWTASAPAPPSHHLARAVLTLEHGPDN